MPIDARIPLQVQSQPLADPIHSIGQLMQMRNMAQQLQQRQALAEQEQARAAELRAQTEQKNRDLTDQNTIQELSKDPEMARAFGAGDFSALNGKVQPNTISTITGKSAEVHSKLATTHQNELENMQKEHGLIAGAINGLKSLGDDAAIAEEAPATFKRLQSRGVIPHDTPMPTITSAKDLDRFAARNAWLQGAVDKALATKKTQQGLDIAAAADKRAADLAPGALTKQGLDITKAEQETTGTQPISPYQQAQLDAKPDAMERNPTEASLALKVALGKAPDATPEAKANGLSAEAALKRLDQSRREGRPVTAATSATGDDVSETAKAIIEGKAVPTLSNYSFRDRTALAAALHRAGYDQATAERDWKAVQRHLSTLNGAQQERLRQAITFTSDSLDNIENLYGEWQKIAPTSGYKILNKATLAAAKQGPGKIGSLATNLEAQINDLTSELGTVYKGGNASTDESLRLAAGNLKADWNEQTFKDAVKQIRKNLGIRKNSIMTSEAAGVSPNSPYTPPGEHAAPSAPKATHRFNPATGKIEEIK